MFARLAAEGAHDAQAAEGFGGAGVDARSILAHRAVDRPDALQPDVADDRQRRQEQQRNGRQLGREIEDDHDGKRNANGGDGGLDEGLVDQAGDGVDIARKPAGNAARFHVGEVRQRQPKQSREQSAAKSDEQLAVEHGASPIAREVARLLHEQQRDGGEGEKIQPAIDVGRRNFRRE